MINRQSSTATSHEQEPQRNSRRKTVVWISIAAIALVGIVVVLYISLVGGNSSAKKLVFSPSDGIDDNGFWKDLEALAFVELFDYNAFVIPTDVYEISDEDVSGAIADLITEYISVETIKVTNRAVVKGDTVNISYVGSVDGVEFENGSTGEGGTEVTAGSEEYIDGFLTQIIGHLPGETVNVEVTFPSDYGNDDLNGKNALFVTTINYILEQTLPELTDEFVEMILYDDERGYDWKTVSELQDGMRNNLKNAAVKTYIGEYLFSQVTVFSIPPKLTAYYENSVLDYYQNYAAEYEMDLDEFLSVYIGFSGREELFEYYAEENLMQARYYLICQAIAEDSGIFVTEDDMIKYLNTDYTDLISDYGLPYLKQFVLGWKVLDHIFDNAVLS